MKGNPRSLPALVLLAVPLAFAGCGGGGSAASVPAGTSAAALSVEKTISAWAAPMANATASTANPAASEQTFRAIVHPTVSGDRVSVHFSNVLGTAAVTIGAATIGTVVSGASESGTVPLTFGGKTSMTLAAGASVSSDPVKLSYAYGSLLAVTEYLSGSWSSLPQHGNSGLWTNYETPAGAGNQTNDTAGTTFTQTTSETFLVDRLDVTRSDYKETVAFIGSSTTAGYGSDPNKYDDMVSDVATNLHAAGLDDIGVVNLSLIPDALTTAGVTAGNPAVVDRLNRDVLSVPGLAIIVQNAADVDLKSACLPAQQILTGDQSVIAAAHAAGVKVFLTVIAPTTFCDGANPSGFGSRFPAGTGQDLQRELLNAWIESTSASTVNGVTEAPPGADAVVDISTPIADPSNTAYMLPQYDVGDDSHVTTAGQALQAAQFSPKMF